MKIQKNTSTSLDVFQKAIVLNCFVRAFFPLLTLGWIVGSVGMPIEASANMLDLTFAGASGTINEALFWEGSVHPSGSGVIRSFVRIDGHNNDVEEGYNTDARPVEFDEKTDPNFTHSLLLTDVPIVPIGGVEYREFFLDINEPAAAKKATLSLDMLQIFLLDAPDLNDYSTFGTPLYDLDTVTTDNWIKLDYNLNSGGSGWADMFAYIPNNLFAGSSNEYVYLYSKFGVNEPNDSNYEEWAVKESAPIPEPSTLLLLGSGLLGLGLAGVRRNFKK